MWYYVLPGILIAALVLVVVLISLKERDDSIAELQHTIAVNLGILKNELVELNAVAETSTLSGAPAATLLLTQAGSDAKTLEETLYTASHSQLQDMLGETFAAMDKANEARHLLDACHPLGSLE